MNATMEEEKLAKRRLKNTLYHKRYVEKNSIYRLHLAFYNVRKYIREIRDKNELPGDNEKKRVGEIRELLCYFDSLCDVEETSRH